MALFLAIIVVWSVYLFWYAILVVAGLVLVAILILALLPRPTAKRLPKPEEYRCVSDCSTRPER